MTTKEAIGRQVPRRLIETGLDDKYILRCPTCGIGLAVKYYSPVVSYRGLDHIPPVSKYCMNCGQRLMGEEEKDV